MTELKTLKDLRMNLTESLKLPLENEGTIENLIMEDDIVPYKKLKAEAIKWC